MWKDNYVGWGCFYAFADLLSLHLVTFLMFFHCQFALLTLVYDHSIPHSLSPGKLLLDTLCQPH